MSEKAFFYQWETVDFPIQIIAEDGSTGILEDCENVVVSLKQATVLLEKDKSSSDIALDVENDTINIHLSQEDTGLFNVGNCVVQVNVLYENSERDTTAQTNIAVYENLHKKVMNG